MTIPATTRKAGPYSGTGVQTAWPFTFRVLAASDIEVAMSDALGVETVLVLGTDYSVAVNANQDTSPGGTVTYPISGSPLPVGDRLTIIGGLDYDQPLDLPSGGNFAPFALENQLDRMVMQIQQINEKIDRALRLAVTTVNAVSPELPPPQASSVIGWNETATGLANLSGSSLATIVAYGTANADVFIGDGAATVFGLSDDPGALANLDVAINGVTQVPGVNYTWASGTNITFTTAPALGASVLVRYMQGLPIGQVNDGSVSQVKLDPALDAAIVYADTDQTLTGAKRGAVTADNDLSLSLSAGNNFSCTPTGSGTLTFTNLVAGQSGFILLVNGANHTISAAATTKVVAGTLTTISATGTYLLSYFCDGTNVFVVNSGAFA
jgi:hypothetical protein